MRDQWLQRPFRRFPWHQTGERHMAEAHDVDRNDDEILMRNVPDEALEAAAWCRTRKRRSLYGGILHRPGGLSVLNSIGDGPRRRTLGRLRLLVIVRSRSVAPWNDRGCTGKNVAVCPSLHLPHCERMAAVGGRIPGCLIPTMSAIYSRSGGNRTRSGPRPKTDFDPNRSFLDLALHPC